MGIGRKIVVGFLCALLLLFAGGCGNSKERTTDAKRTVSNQPISNNTAKTTKKLQGVTAKQGIITGKVIKVADGDTLTVLGEGNIQYKIRLSAIDAPEKAQPFGTKAKQALSAMTMSRQVTVKVLSKDKYGRFIGLISTEEEPDVNGAMLAQGMAWHYAYFDKTEKYAELEQEAKNAKRGLWHDADPTPPWNYRRAKKHKNK